MQFWWHQRSVSITFHFHIIICNDFDTENSKRNAAKRDVIMPEFPSTPIIEMQPVHSIRIILIKLCVRKQYIDIWVQTFADKHIEYAKFEFVWLGVDFVGRNVVLYIGNALFSFLSKWKWIHPAYANGWDAEALVISKARSMNEWLEPPIVFIYFQRVNQISGGRQWWMRCNLADGNPNHSEVRGDRRWIWKIINCQLSLDVVGLYGDHACRNNSIAFAANESPWTAALIAFAYWTGLSSVGGRPAPHPHPHLVMNGTCMPSPCQRADYIVSVFFCFFFFFFIFSHEWKACALFFLSFALLLFHCAAFFYFYFFHKQLFI